MTREEKDPKFPDYVYARPKLVSVYKDRTGTREKDRVATLFKGEWMKVLERGGMLPSKGRAHVAYRGGKGYVDRNDVTRRRGLEVFFIDVRQGDSILIQTPDDRRVLVDGGKGKDACQFIRSKYRLDKADNYIDFEAIVATHSDEDHLGGLLHVLECPKIAVKRVYHNGLFRRAKGPDPGPKRHGRVFGLFHTPPRDENAPLKKLMKRFLSAAEKARENLSKAVEEMRKLERWRCRLDPEIPDMVFKRLDATDDHLPPYDGTNPYVGIEILWPRATPSPEGLSYPYYEKDVGKTVNGNSIVLRLVHGRNSILLAGDLNESAMKDMLKQYPPDEGGKSRLRSDVYKAAHHGSQDFSVPFLEAVSPNAAVISSGDDAYDQHGHPRAILMGTITRYSSCRRPAVFCTELAACFRKLPKKYQKLFDEGSGQVYERAVRGIVHLRSDSREMTLGTVFGRKPPRDYHDNTLWKWDTWSKDEGQRRK